MEKCEGFTGMSCHCCLGLCYCEIHKDVKECPEYPVYMRSIEEYEKVVELIPPK